MQDAVELSIWRGERVLIYNDLVHVPNNSHGEKQKCP
jgi:hypothetical protein